jgi:prevent-host-death family protein
MLGMKKTVNVHEAKTHFSKLLKRVMKGERIVIAKNGTPVAELRPLGQPHERHLGELRGKIRVADDFNAPLPEDALRDFER